MSAYDASAYGERIADAYDEWPTTPKDAEPAAAFLAELAGKGRALELGIGTGRVALPLRAHGVDVQGIDASPAMVEKLRQKPGGADIPVTMADFSEIDLEQRFRLIFVVFNTFFALLTQELQVRCFRESAAHLEPGGAFVLEAFVPDPARYDRGQRLSAIGLDSGRVLLDAGLHDPLRQRVSAQHIALAESGTRLYPVELRYCWPSELDLMARLAGLTLEDRFGGWRREPFTAVSGKHVSVYRAAR